MNRPYIDGTGATGILGSPFSGALNLPDSRSESGNPGPGPRRFA